MEVVLCGREECPQKSGSPVVAAGPGILSRRHMAPVPPRTHSFVGSQDLKAAQTSGSIMPSNTPSVRRELGGGKGSRGQGGCGPGRLWARDGFINKADVVGARLPRQGVPGEVGTQTLAASAGTEIGQGPRRMGLSGLQLLLGLERQDEELRCSLVNKGELLKVFKQKRDPVSSPFLQSVGDPW